VSPRLGRICSSWLGPNRCPPRADHTKTRERACPDTRRRLLSWPGLARRRTGVSRRPMSRPSTRFNFNNGIASHGAAAKPRQIAFDGLPPAHGVDGRDKPGHDVIVSRNRSTSRIHRVWVSLPISTENVTPHTGASPPTQSPPADPRAGIPRRLRPENDGFRPLRFHGPQSSTPRRVA
jgi:hypothetical protein